MMVLLLLYTPKHNNKKLDQKIMKITPILLQTATFLLQSQTKKVFFTHIETKSKRNVFVLTEVPKDNYCKKTKQKAKKNLAKKNPNEIYSEIVELIFLKNTFFAVHCNCNLNSSFFE